ncbi:MAG: hypothetical protein U9N30_10650 [Campylobacterota bacterium]|nr:hypothetical protein [Campylobacterota bacterium]
MEKNSFTLFETLLSVLLLSIVVAGFYKLSTASNDQQIYAQFQSHNAHQHQEAFDYVYDDGLETAQLKITNGVKFKKIIYTTPDIKLENYTLETK